MLSKRQEDVLTAWIDALFYDDDARHRDDPSRHDVNHHTSHNANKMTKKKVDDDVDETTTVTTLSSFTLSSDPMYRQAIQIAIQEKLPSFGRMQLLLLLHLFANPVGTMILSLASWLYTTTPTTPSSLPTISLSSLDRIPIAQRVILLQSFETSSNPMLRLIFQGMKRLLCGIALTYYHTIPNTRDNQDDDLGTTAGNSRNHKAYLPGMMRRNNKHNKKIYHPNHHYYYNPLWEEIGYPGPLISSSQVHSYQNAIKKYHQQQHQHQLPQIKQQQRHYQNRHHHKTIITSESSTWKSQDIRNTIQNAIVSVDDDDNGSRLSGNKTQTTTTSSITSDDNPDNNHNNKLSLKDEYDFIIVGSGSGGCVATYVLSNELSNQTILLVERGSAYINDDDITNLEGDAMDRMYQQHGLLTSSDQNILLLAGNTLGGGTTVNWCCCLPLPNYVLREWNQILSLSDSINKNNNNTNHNDDIVLGQEYHEALDWILQRICQNGTSNDTPFQQQHNRMNQIFIQGCVNMNYQYNNTFVNLLVRDRNDPSAGYICFGDKYNIKNGGIQAFLYPAMKDNSNHNNNTIHILTESYVHRVLTKYDPTMTSRRRAIGIECYISSSKTHDNNHKTVRFTKTKKKVYARNGIILCAGALQTPCILQRSKFRNQHIGKHLYLHPVTAALGFTTTTKTTSPLHVPNKNQNNNKGIPPPPLPPPPLPPVLKKKDNFRIDKDSKYINCFWGAPMTSVCNEFAMGPNDDGYGCKLECPLMHPGLGAAFGPWKSPQQYYDMIRRFNQVIPICLIQRDSGAGGTVRSNQYGELIIDYQITKCDEQSLINGLKGAIQVLVAGNMKEIAVSNIRDIGFRVTSPSKQDTGNEYQLQEQQIQQYLNYVEKMGLKPYEASFASAHQMGTCRMGHSPETGVVDLNGETWECDQLFIMDTSIFPTASGSNPMITVLTLAYMLSKRLSLMLKYKNKQTVSTTHDSSCLIDQMNQGRMIEQKRYDMRRGLYQPSLLLHEHSSMMTLYKIAWISIQYSPFLLTFLCLLWFLWFKK